MIYKFSFPSQFALYIYLSFFLLLVASVNMNAQCAGSNNTVPAVVCDIPNISSQTIDLFSYLGGSPMTGGTWKDNDLSGGLNTATGILNAQQIIRSGIYTYTYTVTNGVGCLINSATITVTIGGYPGVGSIGNVCKDDGSFNLFQVFDSRTLDPQINGIWLDDDGTRAIVGNILDATHLVVNQTYHFTYKMGAVGACSEKSTIIQVVIKQPVNSGTPSPLKLCSNQLSSYSSYNLNNSLAGEDPNGSWSESGTNEISGPADSTVDLQNVYNTKGPGIYNFTYTVFSKNRICPNRFSTVEITIEKLLDYTGATLIVKTATCENEIAATNFSATLKNTTNIPDGSYDVTYTVTGNSLPITTTQNFLNNILTFPIASSNFFLPGDYAVTVTNIVSKVTLKICSNIIPLITEVIKINPIPKINNATLTILPVCQNEDATVVFLGLHNLTNGTYDILYNLSAPNLMTSIPGVINVIGGIPSFFIPAGWIPKSGKTTVTITKITNTTTGCTNTSTLNKEFTVNPLPDVSNLAVTIKDICQGQPTSVKLSGLGTLTDITITYTISGSNTASSQTIPLTLNAGEVNFPILATVIPTVGLTFLTITNITNVITGCSIAITKKTDFSVNALPNLPVAADIQPFCTSDQATVANLMPQGSQYKWFDSATSTIPLINTTAITTDDYFVKEVNAVTGCESGLKKIDVIINTTPQINSAIVTINPICQGFNATVNFTTATTNLTDGNYNILYNLSGSNTTAAPVSAILTVASGIPSFIINANLIPKSGNTTIAITKITNPLTGCSNTSTLTKIFVINAVPDVSTMIVTIKDGCLGQDTNVDISGLLNLTNITLSYSVSGANTIGSQTIPLVVSTGKTSFSISGSVLSAVGNNTLIITDITNTGNSCSTSINSISKIFVINAIPNNPTAANQTFCETDFATVANLQPSGNPYKWYASASTNTPLASTAILQTANYFLKEENPTTGCQSNATPINVLINTVAIPILKPNGQDFCGVNKPTILSLSNNTIASVNLVWYDAIKNGKLFTKTSLLSEGVTYYGFDSNSNTNCTSSPLVVTVSLTVCPANPDDLFIPDGFSPNGDGVNETFEIRDIEYLFPNYNLEIFNRYGNILFKGDINKPAWDGKSSNSGFMNGDAPTGVYFYVIQYNKDNLKPKQGQLYLNR
jgi:gliding motility-associated-like protein